MGRLADRVCLVTGSTGIAAATAERLAAEGAAVFVASRSADHCRALAERIDGSGGVIDWRAADLAVEAEAVGAIEACRERFGRIDGLFAVAGGSGRSLGDGPLHEVTLDAWEATFGLNLRPAFLTTRETLRVMLAQPPNASGTRGGVLLMTSVLAFWPSPERFATHAYAATKGAIASLVAPLAAYYGPSLIRVNALAPGLVATPMAARAGADSTTVDYIRRKQPLSGQSMPPEEIASAATFLLSDEARHVTGQVLAVDAGWSVSEAEERSSP
jgi:NAD(P)-dependent dehydrogenase (short-subunit alcohol dehydrogenase family)